MGFCKKVVGIWRFFYKNKPWRPICVKTLPGFARLGDGIPLRSLRLLALSLGMGAFKASQLAEPEGSWLFCFQPLM